MSWEVWGDPPDVCERCDDTNQICLSCDGPITECTCGPDAEPCTCDRCGGGADEPADSEG